MQIIFDNISYERVIRLQAHYKTAELLREGGINDYEAYKKAKILHVRTLKD